MCVNALKRSNTVLNSQPTIQYMAIPRYGEFLQGTCRVHMGHGIHFLSQTCNTQAYYVSDLKLFPFWCPYFHRLNISTPQLISQLPQNILVYCISLIKLEQLLLMLGKQMELSLTCNCITRKTPLNSETESSDTLTFQNTSKIPTLHQRYALLNDCNKFQCEIQTKVTSKFENKNEMRP